MPDKRRKLKQQKERRKDSPQNTRTLKKQQVRSVKEETLKHKKSYSEQCLDEKLGNYENQIPSREEKKVTQQNLR